MSPGEGFCHDLGEEVKAFGDPCRPSAKGCICPFLADKFKCEGYIVSVAVGVGKEGTLVTCKVSHCGCASLSV